ncbi:MAG: threonine synthase [Gemmataceae bacterium]|nr:threonine synthase [Gemmataceae bacterium]
MLSPILRGLKCAECGAVHPPAPLHYCPDDFAPLEAAYERVPALPFPSEAAPTPLIDAPRLAQALGVRRAWVKDEGACQPSLSFKDRAVSQALAAARHFGLARIGCSSTGNLAASVAALCARHGMDCTVFVPDGTPTAHLSALGARVVSVHGSYDDVNRLCNLVGLEDGWGFVNINLRAWYVEGCKAIGHEIAQHLGRLPGHVVAPMASGSLLRMIHKGMKEVFPSSEARMHGAQGDGCAPIVEALKGNASEIVPIREPRTIARSLAVGDPGDGHAALDLIRSTGGWAEDPTDEEIIEGVRLLGRTTGLLAEPAGGAVVAAALRLARAGRIGPEDEVVTINPANGMKNPEFLLGYAQAPRAIPPTMEAFRRG